MIRKGYSKMNKLEDFSKFDGVEVVNSKLIVNESISETTLLDFLKQFYDFEISQKTTYKLDLKHTTVSNKITAFRYSLTRDDFINAQMILNLYNLVKIYNTLDDEFFASSNIYINSIEELLDIKLELQPELKSFAKTISMYFVSLFKSYNKVTYTPLDEHTELPKVYSLIFMISDLLTLSGILSISDNFSINELKYIDGAFVYIKNIVDKSYLSNNMISKFVEGLNHGNIQ